MILYRPVRALSIAPGREGLPNSAHFSFILDTKEFSLADQHNSDTAPFCGSSKISNTVVTLTSAPVARRSTGFGPRVSALPPCFPDTVATSKTHTCYYHVPALFPKGKLTQFLPLGSAGEMTSLKVIKCQGEKGGQGNQTVLG